jgi:hypothetical protein
MGVCKMSHTIKKDFILDGDNVSLMIDRIDGDWFVYFNNWGGVPLNVAVGKVADYARQLVAECEAV